MNVEDVCQRLEDAWRPLYRRDVALDEARPPDLQSLVDELAPDKLPKVLVRLIEIDRWYREQLGCALEQSHYASLFPAWPDAVRDAFETPLDTTGSGQSADGEIPALRCPVCARDTLRVSSDNGSFVCHNHDCKGRFKLKPKADDMAPVLATVGHYEIVGLLGQGGFARVWLAKDPVEQRYVALKIPKRTLDRALADRFIRETRCDYAMLGDPRAKKRIPQLVNWGRDGEVDYIAFEFHNAVPLSDYLAQHETFSPRRAAKFCHQVALTLQIAHDNNIVHRDVKPSNILIHDHEPLLTDFGIAKVLGSPVLADAGQTQGFLGTMSYASPEHRTPERIDARSDVFSLGIVLFQIITGKLPFEGADDFERFLRIADENVPAQKLSKHRPGVDPLLDEICNRCLEKNPERRYQSAAELARDLERYLGSTTERASAPGGAGPQPATTRADVNGSARTLSDIAQHAVKVRGSEKHPVRALALWSTALGLGVVGVLSAWFINGPAIPDDPRIDDFVEFFRNQLPPSGKVAPNAVLELEIDYERRHALDHKDLERAVPKIAAVLQPFHDVKLHVKHPSQSLDDDYLKAILQAVGPKVQSLMIRFVGGYTQEGLSGIDACPNLVALEFSGQRVNDLSFVKHKRLHYLRIVDAPRLTDEHLRSLDTTELIVLDLIKCREIRFAEPPALQKLTTLILSNCDIDAVSLGHIATLTNLRTLVLGAGDYGIEHLQPLSRLERLNRVILPKRLEMQQTEIKQIVKPLATVEFGMD